MKSVSRLFVVVALCLACLLSTFTDVAFAGNAGKPEVCGMSPEVSGLLSGVKIYPYECEYRKTSSGQSYYLCFMEDTFSLGKENLCMIGMNTVGYVESYSPQIQFFITAFDKAFASICNRSAKFKDEKMTVNVSLTMADGEVFFVKGSFLDNRKDEFHDLETIGGGALAMGLMNFSSNEKALTTMSDINKIRYVAQKLRTYDIKRIQFEGFSLNLDKFPTHLTLDLMFGTLEEKTGQNIYRYSGSSGSGSGSVSTATQAKATISSITTEHNVYKDGKKGMNVVVDFTVSGMKGKTGLAAAYFYYKSGEALKDLNKAYCTPDGKVSAPAQYTSPYDTSKFTGLKIFIPLDELHMDSGHHELKANVFIFDENDRSISSGSDWTYFTFTK